MTYGVEVNVNGLVGWDYYGVVVDEEMSAYIKKYGAYKADPTTLKEYFSFDDEGMIDLKDRFDFDPIKDEDKPDWMETSEVVFSEVVLPETESFIVV